MGIDLNACRFWGIAFQEIHKVPWSGSADMELDEIWENRLVRRQKKFSYTRDELAGCLVDTYLDESRPMYYVFIDASYQSATAGHPVTVNDISVGPDWLQKLEKFCTVLDIPWREPGWHIITKLA